MLAAISRTRLRPSSIAEGYHNFRLVFAFVSIVSCEYELSEQLWHLKLISSP